MGKVIVMNWVTLDGVMQGPGRPDEDTRDGFERGGWGITYGDEASVAKMGERMGADRAWLFGRRTYEQLLASWNAQGGPFKDALNNAQKYVASSNPATKLDWPNSTLLHGDIPAAVADLKKSSSANLVIMGSGVLIGSLMAADLIDEYLLMIAPLVLGTGWRLFPGGTQASLQLVDSTATSTGV
ncbi:MAG TPA: dihydrofolate reductase family protein, partial [Acidobacteriaceae bacterium]